ncbi:MAG: hypothetical protein A2Z21_09345 [Candidatus Fraserbacteria bacterium RBG_16_55_9]|uniref:Uncharacterized protein n=1 Tax=Fraserbacteria sp. (strain RBG_16_55_9) TaxID=1817864 RepID=A0A1F5US05_FRAXR|nr:MAG: hypothetical protein A2Z21_09345 [Candidatus Fraserbacteria bacterium RBG_16_55_9]
MNEDPSWHLWDPNANKDRDLDIAVARILGDVVWSEKRHSGAHEKDVLWWCQPAGIPGDPFPLAYYSQSYGAIPMLLEFMAGQGYSIFVEIKPETGWHISMWRDGGGNEWPSAYDDVPEAICRLIVRMVGVPGEKDAS